MLSSLPATKIALLLGAAAKSSCSTFTATKLACEQPTLMNPSCNSSKTSIYSDLCIPLTSEIKPGYACAAYSLQPRR